MIVPIGRSIYKLHLVIAAVFDPDDEAPMTSAADLVVRYANGLHCVVGASL